MKSTIAEAAQIQNGQEFRSLGFSLDLSGAANDDVATTRRDKNVGQNCPTRDEIAQVTCELLDLAYSPIRDLVGVVRGVDAKRGTVDVHLGHGTLRFYSVSQELVRPYWDEKVKTYTWERLTVLRDEE